MIIDLHMHVDDVPGLGWTMTPELCIERMDEAGIDRAAIMTITDAPALNPRALELIAEACALFPDRLFGFARVHPFYGGEASDLLQRAFSELGYKGLKLHPVSTIAHPSGEQTVRLIKLAAAHGAPTLFHCGDEPLTTPLEIALAAEQCPEATIILGHMGGYFHVDEAILVAQQHPNIVLETSAMPYPGKIKEAVERIGPSRVVFASDGPVCSPRLEIEKIHLAGLRAEDERLVLGGNAEGLLEAVR